MTSVGLSSFKYNPVTFSSNITRKLHKVYVVNCADDFLTKRNGKKNTSHTYLTILRDEKYSPLKEHIFIHIYVMQF